MPTLNLLPWMSYGSCEPWLPHLQGWCVSCSSSFQLPTLKQVCVPASGGHMSDRNTRNIFSLNCLRAIWSRRDFSSGWHYCDCAFELKVMKIVRNELPAYHFPSFREYPRDNILALKTCSGSITHPAVLVWSAFAFQFLDESTWAFSLNITPSIHVHPSHQNLLISSESGQF